MISYLKSLKKLALSELSSATYSISCIDMHIRNGSTKEPNTDHYALIIADCHLVINELDEYIETLTQLQSILEDSFSNETEIEYENLFNSEDIYLITNPTSRIYKFIQFHFEFKQLKSLAFLSYFKNVERKKEVLNENGELELQDWTQKDDLEKQTNDDLLKIEKLNEWESFIETMNLVHSKLKEKQDTLEILKLLKK